MRMSDWSVDVCSSDLLLVLLHCQGVGIDVDRLMGVAVLVEADLRIGRPADNTGYNQGGQNNTHAGSATLLVRENRGLHAVDEMNDAPLVVEPQTVGSDGAETGMTQIGRAHV